MMDHIVEAKNLGKRYNLFDHPIDQVKEFLTFGKKRYHQEFWALKDISFNIKKGESFGVIGENGAGKSTLLKIITGVTKPTTGNVEILGKVGALLDLGTGFHPEYTGRENIFLSGSVMGFSDNEIRDILPEVIEFSDLGDFIDRPVRTYSTGMYVRLGFSIATSINPDLLVTDEVLSVGDENFQKKCIKRMEKFLIEGKTILLCSHGWFHIKKICQKAIWLDHGHLRSIGDASDVVNEYLDFMREKEVEENKRESRIQKLRSSFYNIVKEVRILDGENVEKDEFQMGETIRVEVVIETPPGEETPAVAIGIVRNDQTPVYGICSDMDGVEPKKIEDNLYMICYELPEVMLLPGKYIIRSHSMDNPALRLFDTLEKVITIKGDSRELGICRLKHRWIK
jgi:lipopolysaccharide transport system ATP-binding protein